MIFFFSYSSLFSLVIEGVVWNTLPLSSDCWGHVGSHVFKNLWKYPCRWQQLGITLSIQQEQSYFPRNLLPFQMLWWVRTADQIKLNSSGQGSVLLHLKVWALPKRECVCCREWPTYSLQILSVMTPVLLPLLLLHWLEGNTEELTFLMTRHYCFSNICSNRKKDGQGKVSYGLKVRVITGWSESMTSVLWGCLISAVNIHFTVACTPRIWAWKPAFACFPMAIMYLLCVLPSAWGQRIQGRNHLMLLMSKEERKMLGSVT